VKTIFTLISAMIGAYYGIDFLLGRHFQSQTPASSHQQEELVQKMAQFLDTNDQIQEKLAKKRGTSPPSSAPQEEVAHSSPASQYLGSSPSDQFFKSILDRRATIESEQSGNIDASLNNTIQMLEYVKNNTKETLETLESALGRIPIEMTKDRELLKSAYIHASIQFIEELPEANRSLKMSYLKRFSESLNDPDIKASLLSHFSMMISEDKTSSDSNKSNQE
jgi:hypothetical protein